MTARPFVKSAGGKTKLVPTILEILPKHFTRYHELFVGGGALYWAIHASNSALKTSWLNDLNEPLMNTYYAISANVEGLIKQLGKKRYTNDLESFLKVRADNFDFKSSARRLGEGAARIQAAADFIFTNKCGFNGLFRVNQSGQFNVPFGRYENPTICDAENLRACSLALRKVIRGHMDFEEAAKAVKSGDVVYLDSPYAPVSRTANFTSYIAGGFTSEDQTRLQSVALGLKKKGAFVLLSNADTPFIHALYKKTNWTLKEVRMARNINNDATKRGKVGELLIY